MHGTLFYSVSEWFCGGTSASFLLITAPNKVTEYSSLYRAADPRPFRPLISTIALTLRSMETESQFLSTSSLRPQLQPLLERILVSMNSSLMECNLLLSRSNALNLKLFHPPKPEVSPVHDHEVPILLRRDFQLQMVRASCIYLERRFPLLPTGHACYTV
jgi:hypothetical protein